MKNIKEEKDKSFERMNFGIMFIIFTAAICGTALLLIIMFK